MKYIRRILLVLLPALLLAVVWTQRYDIHDWWQLRGYVPPVGIAQLAEDTAMTDYGRKLFYVNHPELNDKTSFNQNCTISEASIVLGCYVTGEGIYLYDVSDPRLIGVHQVTAAHEMLHAAYDRLGVGERVRVDALTAGVLATITDERLIATIEAYRARDPSIVPNELHSILPTELETLPQELEDYYKQYFSDRLAAVNYSKLYEAAFRERRDKVASYDAQLASVKQDIDAKEVSLDSLSGRISADRQELDSLLAQRRYEEYNAKVPGFNQRVRSYNSLVNQVRSLIETYNRLVVERNAIVLEENELIKAIDSRPETIPTE